MKKEEYLSILKEKLGDYREYYTGNAEVTSVVIKDRNEWKNVITKIVFIKKDEETKKIQNIVNL